MRPRGPTSVGSTEVTVRFGLANDEGKLTGLPSAAMSPARNALRLPVALLDAR